MYGKLVGPDQKKIIPDPQHWIEWQKTMALRAFNTCVFHLFSAAVPGTFTSFSACCEHSFSNLTLSYRGRPTFFYKPTLFSAVLWVRIWSRRELVGPVDPELFGPIWMFSL